MMHYRKLIAVLVGLAVTWLAQQGLDLAPATEAIVEIIMYGVTALAVYLVPNAPKTPPAPPEFERVPRRGGELGYVSFYMLRIVLLAIALMVTVGTAMQGCAVMEQAGLPVAKTPDQRALVVTSTASAVVEGTRYLLSQKRITANDAQHVRDAAVNLRAGLDVYESLKRTDPKAADAKLRSLEVGLRALQAYLSERERAGK